MSKELKMYLAGGCFWCTEAIFQNLKGVSKVVSGYAGGSMENPSYEQVSSESTGHTETIEITYNPEEIAYKDLLYVFLRTHDPTTLNAQGADTGTQYRSSIFYMTESEKKEAEEAIKEVQSSYTSPVVTEVLPFSKFYEAEPYHQDYYNRNGDAMYCQVVIDPKIQKLKKDFKEYLKQ